MGILILPDRFARQPERGAGLDRDGPPGGESREGYCTTPFHDPELPRRFDMLTVGPPTVCPKCRETARVWYEKAKKEGTPLGNRPFRGTIVERGAPPFKA